MKKLISTCMLALCLLATTQFNYANSTTVPNELKGPDSIEDLIASLPSFYAGEQEQEAPMTFEVTDYLPTNFDAYKGMILDESSLLIEEVISFDFNTENYLPTNFDVYKGMIIEKEIIEEEIPFNFNIEDYLPRGFDVNRMNDKATM